MNVQFAMSSCLLATCCAVPAWGQSMPIELKGCLTSETTVIDRAGDVVIGMNVTRGVTDRVGAGSFPEKTTNDCRVVFHASPSTFEFSNRCNFVDAQGDRIISVANGTRDSFHWQWIAGTGKFEGITGSGTGKIDANYPRANPTVSGACWSGKGTYSIKKL
jgi:hypothetical protein